MTEADHVAYFRQRAAAERELAANAPDDYIARIHTTLAERYDELIKEPSRRDVLKIVRDSPAPGVSWNAS